MILQGFKDAAYGKGFTADIDGKKPAPKRKAPEMADEETAFVGEVCNGATWSCHVAHMWRRGADAASMIADQLGRAGEERPAVFVECGAAEDVPEAALAAGESACRQY